MFKYLITPRFVLGSDSFYVYASDTAEAVTKARAQITNEGWGDGEWEVLREETTFTMES